MYYYTIHSRFLPEDPINTGGFCGLKKALPFRISQASYTRLRWARAGTEFPPLDSNNITGIHDLTTLRVAASASASSVDEHHRRKYGYARRRRRRPRDLMCTLPEGRRLPCWQSLFLAPGYDDDDERQNVRTGITTVDCEQEMLVRQDRCVSKKKSEDDQVRENYGECTCESTSDSSSLAGASTQTGQKAAIVDASILHTNSAGRCCGSTVRLFHGERPKKIFTHQLSVHLLVMKMFDLSTKLVEHKFNSTNERALTKRARKKDCRQQVGAGLARQLAPQ
ncbi:hypothetical protein FB45DRAFT_880417 [Roridomyces roridus]|uniref:Uncharacterized protein n=1 Tax=Roridomyces roridus TaxID=1738132 RepID=A0AAD7AZ64_9AGAR|nr:hypothetical protein FB45DRAFT_880417 [Roridomyces roridus]